MTVRRLPTGLDPLDRRLGGGIPAGSLVAFSAPPDSQSELLLYEAAAANPSLYLSTLRPTDEVRDAIAASVGDADIVPRQVDPDALLDEPARWLDLDEGSVVIVDPATGLEQADRERYRAFLDELKGRLAATDSYALLHCHATDPRTLRRDLTLARADVTFELRLDVRPLAVESLLVVTKVRRGVPPREPIRLRVGERVRVDTDRDIA